MRKGDREMEQLKKLVVAWAKLATTGARPVGEKAGLTRETFSRVLSNRRQLQDEEAVQVGDVLGLGIGGFKGKRIESNLCRFLSDIGDLERAGIQLEFLAHIRSAKELRGGVALQRYCAVLATFGRTQRLMVLRMATAKYDELMMNLKLPVLPTVEVDTLVLPLLSDITSDITETEWAEFAAILEQARPALKTGSEKTKDSAELVRAQAVVELGKWVGKTLVAVLKTTEAGRLTGSMARRIRSTDLSKVAADHEVLAIWPTAAKEFSRKRVLTPLTSEYAPFQAVGLLANGKPVFVFMAVVSELHGIYVPSHVREVDGYVIVFSEHENEFSRTSEPVYEGQVRNLVPVLEDETLNRDIGSRREGALSYLRLLASSVPEQEKITKRAIQP